jgi:hypothetical protein
MSSGAPWRPLLGNACRLSSLAEASAASARLCVYKAHQGWLYQTAD